MKICTLPSSFQKELSAVMIHAFHVTIRFFSGSSCLIEKPLTLINFTTNMISKIFCPLSPKSQSMTCFDNSKRAQIKHNKV